MATDVRTGIANGLTGAAGAVVLCVEAEAVPPIAVRISTPRRPGLARWPSQNKDREMHAPDRHQRATAVDIDVHYNAILFMEAVFVLSSKVDGTYLLMGKTNNN